MRTLHIDTGREMRGGQWQALFLIEALAKRGHEAVLLAAPASPLFREAVRRGLDARPARARSIWRLSRAAEVTHAHDARGHTLAAALSRAPVVVSRRVAFDVRRGALSRWKYGRASHYIAVSEFVKDRLTAAGVGPSRVSVIYDAVPAVQARSRAEIVLAPATEDPMKGSELVLRAAAAGGWHPIFSDRLAEDLQRAAVFVYISRSEGLGSAVLLAMAAGVPVVASRVGGIPEIVHDGETGLLVENTPEAIAGAVYRVMADPVLASRLSDAARRHVEQCFSVAALVEKTLQVYEKVR